MPNTDMKLEQNVQYSQCICYYKNKRDYNNFRVLLYLLSTIVFFLQLIYLSKNEKPAIKINQTSLPADSWNNS